MVYITTSILTFLTLISYTCSMLMLYIGTCVLIEWDVILFSSFTFTLPIILDPTSMIFMSTVLTIASSVTQFAKTYMAHDKSSDRFTILVLLFILSMVFLILFPHTITLLLGWDGLGVTSFVLVIYYNNPKSLGAGMITALTNRIGDVMLLITIALMMNEGQWLITNIWANEIPSWVALLILIAAMTKSAQMPFSSWLPAAMAAPTPVSALVHSSTLVTAGVYLLYRFYPLMKTFMLFKPILLMISTMTMLMASASAMAECDMKKIIALSTLSQVAVMMFTLSIGLPEIAFFHLITHALFKALLFICAGNMIDIHHHSQDLRLMGNISSQLPTISAAISIANLALCGAPFMAGFYSKDLIIETSSMLLSEKNIIIMIMFITATILTTAYSTRFSIYILMNHTCSPSAQYSSEGAPQYLSVITLTFLAISGGAITNWLFTTPVCEPNFSSFTKTIAPTMIALGSIMGIMTFMSPVNSKSFILTSHCFMWFLTPLSTHFMPKITMILPFMELKETDQGWSLISSLMLEQLTKQSHLLISAQNNTIMNLLMTSSTLILWMLWMT
uniref:NADH-ubiquinone oxidoreductase chain 5 n=1 Tax=Platynereis massiliensis TaxID=1623346 RepID=A0A7G8JTN7_9ANNE|nr:NADH dehydrogenase subunit 5 [Platynereis massiliensis]QNJ33935.1 NADH dehydrogenase subunit 5 [Platynereis massiliensis]